MSRGQYVDPKAARITFQQYAERWIAGQTTDPNTRIAVGQHHRGDRLSEYLGHSDPAMTLRVYAHLMPSSSERARRALDGVFGDDVSP